MLTTPNDFLQETSDLLNESQIDTSTKRVRFFNRAMRRVKKVRKWSWNKKAGTMTLSGGTQEYDLTGQFTDYNPQWGIYEVYLAGEKLSPVNYNQISTTTGDHFYLKPDGKTIGFTFEVEGDESVVVWYNPRHTNAAAYNSTLDVSVPEDMLGPVALLMKSYVHNAKRQRNDERNTLLEYKEEIEETVLQDASNKIKDLPNTVPTPFTYNGVRRNYRF